MPRNPKQLTFISFKNALNKLACGFGDCIIDKFYADGLKHRFWLEDGVLYYEAKGCPKEPQKIEYLIGASNYACVNRSDVYGE